MNRSTQTHTGALDVTTARAHLFNALREAPSASDPIGGVKKYLALIDSRPEYAAALTDGERRAVASLRQTLSDKLARSQQRAAGAHLSRAANSAAATSRDVELFNQWRAMPPGPERSDFGAQHFDAIRRGISAAK